MMTLETRNTITNELFNFMGIPVIPDDDDGDVPDYPYIVYSDTTDNTRRGHDSITYTNTEEGFEKTYSNQVGTSYSFNAYSDSRDQAKELAFQMIEFFGRLGRDRLNNAGVAVQDVSSLQNRSLMLIDHYVRRYGIDVQFNYVDESSYPVDSIDQTTITGG
ncbi:LIC_12616 family protein [Halobacillus sp. SY10]|uniref:phage neck terminator protein n=1 Tax=Halobacillus sp. SY10 TaxID=3381356 RepID=UPI00387A57E3